MNYSEILKAIDVCRFSQGTGMYNVWLAISTAYKKAGGSFEVWDEWCQEDEESYSRMADPERKWDSLRARTKKSKEEHLQELKRLAAKYGTYKPDVVPLSQSPEDQLISYLKAAYEPNDYLKIITKAFQSKESKKWVPDQKNPDVFKQSELVQMLSDGKKIRDIFPVYDSRAGAWIGVNPIKPNAANSADDKAVSEFRYVLLEFDDISIPEQYKFFLQSDLPIATLTYSGRKSIHALIRVDADDEKEYRERVSDLYKWLNDEEIYPDSANKNPSRLSRLPGFCRMKGDEKDSQYLIDTRETLGGKENYLEWFRKYRKPSFFEEIKPADKPAKQKKNKPSNQEETESKPGKSVFLHHVMAEWLMKVENIKRIDGSFYLFDRKTGIYLDCDDQIRGLIREEIPFLKNSQVNEVQSYIVDKLKQNRNVQHSKNSDYIAFQNGALNIETFEFEKLKPSMNLTSIILHDYNDKPKQEVLTFCNQVMDDWTMNRDDMKQAYLECLGCCLESKLENDPHFYFLTGPTNSGKSTALNLICRILGPENFSNVEPSQFREKNLKILIKDKKANIVNDISHVSIKDTNEMKKITSGDAVTDQEKYKTPVTFVPHATLVFSANKLPNLEDNGGAISSRLIILSFDQTFDPSADTNNVKERLKDEEVLEGFIYLGIEALKRMRETEQVTVPLSSKQAWDKERFESKPVWQFFDEWFGDRDYFNNGDYQKDLELSNGITNEHGSHGWNALECFETYYGRDGKRECGRVFNLKRFYSYYLAEVGINSKYQPKVQFKAFKSEATQYFGVEFEESVKYTIRGNGDKQRFYIPKIAKTN